MIRNYLNTLLRSLWRDRFFSSINIVGLALGLVSILLIYLWVADEKSYDQFHRNKQRLYEVLISDHYADGKVETRTSTPGILADALKHEVPEITDAVLMTWEDKSLFAVGEKVNKEKGRYA